MTLARSGGVAAACLASLALASSPVVGQNTSTSAPAETAADQAAATTAPVAEQPRRGRFSGLRSAASGMRNRAAAAARNMTSALPNGAFSVTGRDGAMLDTVDPAQIQTRVIQQEAMGLANEGNNTGTFDGLRLRMPETEAALNALLDRVDAGWPHDRPTAARVLVLASNEYGPETLADGSIMVRMGLLNRADSDDEVALMLGHELSHVRLGHFADDGGFRRKRQLATLVGKLYFTAVAASEVRARESGDQIEWVVDDQRHVDEQRDRAAEARAMINELMTLMFERTWARRQEDEADALGYDLTVKANMAAMAAAEKMYDRIDADFDLRKAASDNLFEGLQYTLDTAVTRQNIDAVASGNGAAVTDALSAPLQRIARDRLLGMARGYFNQRHRAPEARLKGIVDYSDRAHADLALVEVQTTWLTAVRRTDEYREATIVVDSLRDAAERENAHDIAGAIAAMQPAQRTRRFARAPAVANAVASLYGISGNVSEADRLYTQAHASRDQSAAAFVEHAWLLVSNRRYARAKEVIALGLSRAEQGIDAEKAFLPALTAMAFQQNKKDEGMTYLQRCIAYEEDGLTEKCIHAAMGLGLRDPNQPIDLDTQVRIHALVRQTTSQAAVGGDMDAIASGLSALFN